MQWPVNDIAPLEPLLTYAQASRALGFKKDAHHRALKRLIESGALVAVDLGLGQQGKRVAPYDLQKYIHEHRTVDKRLTNRRRR